MPKPTAIKRKQSKSENGKPTEIPERPSIPLSAVPHLYNEKMLEWQQTNLNALKAIHERLGEILAALKED